VVTSRLTRGQTSGQTPSTQVTAKREHLTGFPDLCSMIKTLTGFGCFVALVRVVFVVVEDAVHHGRSPRGLQARSRGDRRSR